MNHNIKLFKPFRAHVHGRRIAVFYSHSLGEQQADKADGAFPFASDLHANPVFPWAFAGWAGGVGGNGKQKAVRVHGFRKSVIVEDLIYHGERKHDYRSDGNKYTNCCKHKESSPFMVLYYIVFADL